MVSRTTARNQTQRAGKIIRVNGRITSAPVGIYTCPDGRAARVTDMLMIVDATGTDAFIHLAILNKAGTVFTQISRRVDNTPGENEVAASAVTMTEGEKLTDIGDSGGTNATVDISATVEEFGA